jgi:hypothetical protein
MVESANEHNEGPVVPGSRLAHESREPVFDLLTSPHLGVWGRIGARSFCGSRTGNQREPREPEHKPNIGNSFKARAATNLYFSV